MSVKELIDVLGNKAKTASMTLRNVSTEQKNQALLAIAENIGGSRNDILKANQLDIENAQEKNLSDALIDRLLLNEERIDSIIQSLNQIALLEDPVGEITDLKYRPSGIQVGKMRVPLGVLGIIYESRPNVTIDASALCLKS
ncbi:MAG: gamma-glutamyl-phosphate reductase, partial [Gammaproteobacteria bacterium]|nr:gamma-glutamyl-phosphate reductase [Gammaproteobacteria bacterium]